MNMAASVLEEELRGRFVLLWVGAVVKMKKIVQEVLKATAESLGRPGGSAMASGWESISDAMSSCAFKEAAAMYFYSCQFKA